MQKLLSALALLLTLLLPISPALAAPTDDPTFDRLDQWATNLDNQGQNWSQQCTRILRGNSLNSLNCQHRLKALQDQWKQFIKLAGQYKSNGTGCRAMLNQRWIQFRIRSFTFNLKYAGSPDTSRQAEEFELRREGLQLKQEIKNCTGK